MSCPALSLLVAQVIDWVIDWGALAADAGAVAVPLFVPRRNGQVPTVHLDQTQARGVAEVLDKGAVRPAFHFVKGVAAVAGY